MAGFTGSPRRLGSAGIPPDPTAPFVTATTSIGTDTFYEMGIVFAEDISPNGAANPPVQVTETGSAAGDSYYVLGIVMSESGSPGASSGMFRAFEAGSVGGDTYYILAIVFSES